MDSVCTLHHMLCFCICCCLILRSRQKSTLVLVTQKGTWCVEPCLLTYFALKSLRAYWLSAIGIIRPLKTKNFVQKLGAHLWSRNPEFDKTQELDKTYASSMILAYSLAYVKTWRHPQNRKYITHGTAIRGRPSHGTGNTYRQEAQLSPRDPRDALYQLKYFPAVAWITQTDRASAWWALSATAIYSTACIVLSQLSHSEHAMLRATYTWH